MNSATVISGVDKRARRVYNILTGRLYGSRPSRRDIDGEIQRLYTRPMVKIQRGLISLPLVMYTPVGPPTDAQEPPKRRLLWFLGRCAIVWTAYICRFGERRSICEKLRVSAPDKIPTLSAPIRSAPLLSAPVQPAA